MQLLHIDIISGFLLILGVESIAHKFVDHKGKGKVEYQTNNNEDGDDFNVGDTPDDMKLKIPRISGQGDGQSHRSTNCQDDHLTIPVPTSNRKPLTSVSPCFSSKKVLGIWEYVLHILRLYLRHIFLPVIIKELPIRKPQSAT